MEYGPAPESPSVANAWLDDHGRNFGHFINGQWVRPEGRKVYDTHNPATGEKLASTVQGGWSLGCINMMCTEIGCTIYRLTNRSDETERLINRSDETERLTNRSDETERV